MTRMFTYALTLLVSAQLWAGSATAAVYDYTFEVQTFEASGPDRGWAAGIVRGLAEGINTVSSVEILSNTLGFGVGTYTHNDDQLGAAIWTVTGGDITDFTFLSFGQKNIAPDVTDSALALTGFGVDRQGLRQGGVVSLVATPVVFTRVEAVPLPLSAAFLGSGLLGFGLVRRRKG